MALHEILTRASKTPKNEKPRKKPQSASKFSHLRINVLIDNWRSSAGVSNVYDKADQRGERVDELLHLVPGDVRLDGQDLPRLVGDSPQDKQKMVSFHSCCLLLVGKTVVPECLYNFFSTFH